MQKFLQHERPTVLPLGTPHVKPVMHGDSGTRSQSLSAVHSAVHRPLLFGGNALPGGSSRSSGTRKHVRDTQSSDGDATTDSSAAGWAVPRSQMRPTGLLSQPVAVAAIDRRTTSTA